MPSTGTPPSYSRVRKVSSSESPDLPCSNGSVSSARQRRRRNKQLESGAGGVARGRVVLRSRSSSDLARKSSSESLSSKASAEDLLDGMDEPPNGGQARVQGHEQAKQTKVNEGKILKLDKVVQSGVCDSEQSVVPLVPQVKINPEEIELSNAEPLASEHRDGGSSDEVDEFLTLLDTTLHLPEPQRTPNQEGDDTPQSREAFIEKKGILSLLQNMYMIAIMCVLA